MFSVVIIVVGAWLLVGAVVGLIAARHGHWRAGWLLAALAGPLAVPLALRAGSPGAAPVTVDLEAGGRGGHGVRVLAGVDGSAEARAAVDGVVDLLGEGMDRMTLATVLDYESIRPPADDPPIVYPERRAAEAALHALADDLAPRLGFRPGTVLLAGEPAAALATEAESGGYDVVVAGTRGRGLTRAVFGSCATALASAPVPVLLVPASTQPGRGHGDAVAERGARRA